MIRKMLLLTAILSSTACSSGLITYEAPNLGANLDQTDLKINDIEETRIEAEPPVVDWWQEFDDPLLSRLVEEALENNPSIRIAIANFKMARALARETNYDRYPSANLNSSYTRERQSSETAASLSGDSFNNYMAGFDAGWELDLFDRVTNRVEASVAEKEAVAEDLKFIHVSIAAEVARTYIELRGAQYRHKIATRNAEVQRQTLALTRTLTRGGIGNNLDIVQAETQLALTEAELPRRKAAAVAAINRLVVLTGMQSDVLTPQLMGERALPSLPNSVKVGNVSELIQRRPDIQAAERRLAAATAKYNVAVADQFPAVSIVGSLGFIATNLASLGTGSAISAAIGPTMSWGVFDMGRIRARIEQNDAASELALANYELTVLEALEETKTAVSDFAREEQRREHLRKAADSSVRATEIAKQRFKLGDTDFLPVLDSERTRLSAEDSLAVSEIQSAVNLVRIYKSLGRGWEVSE